MRPAGALSRPVRRALLFGGLALAALFVASLLWWNDDIQRTRLDPKQPYQTYKPPSAPDYAAAASWALLPADPSHPGAGARADVFFVHPTTYDGGRDWNAPIGSPAADALLQSAMLPNYAGPFAKAGRVFAPRYRQASLYALLTLREDARDARRFAYADVRRAFDLYLARWSADRPLVIVGVEQGGVLAARLAAEVASDSTLKRRLAVVYLIQTAVPAPEYGADAQLPACSAPVQRGCVIAYVAADERETDAQARYLDRAAVWTPRGQLDPWDHQAPLCVDPVTGAVGRPASTERENRGAVNATGLEWGARPALLPQQVAAHCDAKGFLRVTAPRSPALQRTGGWADRLRTPAFNLFYADLESDVMRRLAAPSPAP